MTVHVLDTGAVFLLHNKHNPPLLAELRAARRESAVWIHALVLAEANQAKKLENKKLERILEIADLAKDLDVSVAQRAAEALRMVKRDKCGDKCDKCSGFMRPSLVDAVVMAFAERYAAEAKDDVIVYTGDLRDMELLQDALFKSVLLRGLSA